MHRFPASAVATPLAACLVAVAVAACGGARPAWTFEPAGAVSIRTTSVAADPEETAEPGTTAEPTTGQAPSPTPEPSTTADPSAKADAAAAPAPTPSAEPTASTLAGTSGATAAAPAAASVRIAAFRFSPSTITVAAGGTVTWTNDDADDHTVQFGGSESPDLGQGGAFRRTFATAGRYAYICGIHESMTGEVVVVAVTEGGMAPQSSSPQPVAPPIAGSSAAADSSPAPAASPDGDDDEGGRGRGRGRGGDDGSNSGPSDGSNSGSGSANSGSGSGAED